MKRSIVESITKSLKELNKDGFVDDSAMKDIESLSLSEPSHPGEIIKDLILEPLNLSVENAAQHLEVDEETFSKIVNDKKPVTGEMALRLEIVFGNMSAEHWLSMQNTYDLWQIREKINNLNLTPI